MIKTKEITQEQLNQLKDAENPVEVFKELVNLQPEQNYGMGDTGIKVENAKPLDVFKSNFKGQDYYYIVTTVVDEEMAYAYSLYPED